MVMVPGVLDPEVKADPTTCRWQWYLESLIQRSKLDPTTCLDTWRSVLDPMWVDVSRKPLILEVCPRPEVGGGIQKTVELCAKSFSYSIDGKTQRKE